MAKLTVAAAAVALFATQAVAAPPSGAWQVGNDSYHLYYADLDMRRAEDRATLLARVEKIAGKLCDQPLAVDQKDCTTETLAKLPNPDVQRALAERARGLRLAGR